MLFIFKLIDTQNSLFANVTIIYVLKVIYVDYISIVEIEYNGVLRHIFSQLHFRDIKL